MVVLFSKILLRKPVRLYFDDINSRMCIFSHYPHCLAHRGHLSQHRTSAVWASVKLVMAITARCSKICHTFVPGENWVVGFHSPAWVQFVKESIAVTEMKGNTVRVIPTCRESKGNPIYFFPHQ